MKFALATTPESCPQQISILRILIVFQEKFVDIYYF